MASLARTFGAASIGVLSALAPALPMTPAPSQLSSLVVSPAPDAAPLIQPNRSAVVSVVQDAQAMKNEITQVIRQAQTEIVRAAVELGHDPVALFPQASMSQADLAMDLVMPGAMGNIFTLREAMLDRAKSPDRDAALAEIELKLREVSRMPGTGGSSLNWDQFFDAGHSLADVMAIDPENPSPEMIPEIRPIISLLAEGRDAMNSLAMTEQKINDGMVPAADSSAPQISAGEIAFFSAANKEMPPITLPEDAPALASCALAGEMLKKKQPDPALDIPPPVFAMAPPSLPVPTGAFFG